jgi:hypothetical protein
MFVLFYIYFSLNRTKHSLLQQSPLVLEIKNKHNYLTTFFFFVSFHLNVYLIFHLANKNHVKNWLIIVVLISLN